MEEILILLDSTYGSVGDIRLTKAWWKLGGDCPLTKKSPISPSKNVSNSNEVNVPEASLKMIEGVHSIYVAQVYILIYQLAASAEINIATDISPETSMLIFNKVIRYCKEKEPDINDSVLKNLILSFLKLAKEDLL